MYIGIIITACKINLPEQVNQKFKTMKKRNIKYLLNKN